MKLLIIGHTHPEPSTTAAGRRMMQLISTFRANKYEIHFACSAGVNPHSENLLNLNIPITQIELNDSSFDHFVQKLDPEIVLFDRYITEEHYSWRVAEACPNALRVLDTEDLHFLRKARESAFKKDGNLSNVDLYTNIAKREIASIMRCDLSLIISEYEAALLTNRFQVSDSILCYLPFMEEILPDKETLTSFDKRNGFMTIGNFFHKPNVDSVLYLKKEIWPKIREELPDASLSIYGNYAPQQINELNNVKEGFIIKGWAPSLRDAFTSSRVCLAPLRFGAGLKGKLLDAMIYGTPAITTSIGAEGMYGNESAGLVKDKTEDIVEAAIELYSDEDTWIQEQKNGYKIVVSRFSKEENAVKLISAINSIKTDLNQHRKNNFMGQIMHHQSLQSTKYFSKWIEEKNK